MLGIPRILFNMAYFKVRIGNYSAVCQTYPSIPSLPVKQERGDDAECE
jgi:hypothetical protein